MKEKCGCTVEVSPITQFEAVIPCEKHDTAKNFAAAMKLFISDWRKNGLKGTIKDE